MNADKHATQRFHNRYELFMCIDLVRASSHMLLQ
jgi:hypothetical protein